MFHRSSKGATMLEVLVAASILGVAIVGAGQFFNNSLKTKKKLQLRAIQETIAMEIKNELSTPSAVYLSTLNPQNYNFIICLLGTLDGCNTTLTHHNPASPNIFGLAYPSITSQTSYITKANPQTPQYFDLNGKMLAWNSLKKCQQDSKCAFSAITFFYATCPQEGALMDPSTCKDGASEVHMGYRVSQVPGSFPDLGKELPILPSNDQFITLTAAQIFGPQNNSECNLGATINGYDSSGKAVCKCSQPFMAMDMPPNRRGPLCRQTLEPELRCAEGLVFRGLTPDGTADCRTFDQAYTCVNARGNSYTGNFTSNTTYSDRPIENIDLTGTCGGANSDLFWVTIFNSGKCSFNCWVTKGGTGVMGNPPCGNSYDAQDVRLFHRFAELQGADFLTVSSNICPNWGAPDAQGNHCQSTMGLESMGVICQNQSKLCCRPNYDPPASP